jgi:PTH1 family peptidyl-tRNA hydrolase
VPGDWLIVGLGNPGPEYEWTPHNAGFLALDRYAERNGIRIHRKECLALVGLGKDVVVAKPQTYMNESGGSVRQLLPKYEIGPEQLLVVYDELALPWGQLRIRARGSDAGHNGMKSIIRSIGTQDFPRLRIGVHPGGERSGGKDYLLAPMRRGQREEMDAIVDRAAEAIESITAFGVEQSMARFNRRAGGEQEEEA